MAATWHHLDPNRRKFAQFSRKKEKQVAITRKTHEKTVRETNRATPKKKQTNKKTKQQKQNNNGPRKVVQETNRRLSANRRPIFNVVLRRDKTDLLRFFSLFLAKI